jgi:hypothetical protein
MGRFLETQLPGSGRNGDLIHCPEGSGDDDGGDVNEQIIPEINGPPPPTTMLTTTTTVPTAPSPISKKSNPFDTIDDVPSIHSDTEDITDQVSQVDIPRLVSSEVPITMTPPLTPPTIITKADVEGYVVEGGSSRLFTRLGGYGWRG